MDNTCQDITTKAAALWIIMTLALPATYVRAFNPTTHIYIANRVFKDCDNKIDLYYGSIAPDLAVPEERWSTAFDDTHYDFIDLRDSPYCAIQKAFARGWLSHNGKWGADFCAHGAETAPGYVIAKTGVLLHKKPSLRNFEFAHFAIEVAIDLLLKDDDPKLEAELRNANLFPSWQDRQLMAKVLVEREGKTDRLTIATAELTFRNLVGRYATASALPSPNDKGAIAELGAQLAKEMYGIAVSSEDLFGILEEAIRLCEADYRNVISLAIKEMTERITR